MLEKVNWSLKISAQTLYSLHIYIDIFNPNHLQTTENKVCLYILFASEQETNKCTENFN